MGFRQTIYNEIRTNAGKVAEKLGVEGIDQLWSGFGKQRTIAEGFETASNWLTNKNVISEIAGKQKINQSSMNKFSKEVRAFDDLMGTIDASPNALMDIDGKVFDSLNSRSNNMEARSKQVLKQFDANKSNLAKQMAQAQAKALNRQVVVGAGAVGAAGVGYVGYKKTFGS